MLAKVFGMPYIRTSVNQFRVEIGGSGNLTIMHGPELSPLMDSKYIFIRIKTYFNKIFIIPNLRMKMSTI